MSKTIEIPDIAMWEETDSELAKYNIQSLSTLIKNQEEQLKANDLMINELINRIDEAIEYIENNDLYTQDIDYDYDDNMVLSPPNDETERKDLLEILRGEDNE